MRRTSLLAKATPFRHSLHSAVRVRVTLSLALSLLSRRYDFEEFPDQEISIWKCFQLFSLFFMTTSFEENEFQFFSLRLALGRGRERENFQVSCFPRFHFFFFSIFLFKFRGQQTALSTLCLAFRIHWRERKEEERRKRNAACLRGRVEMSSLAGQTRVRERREKV